MACAVAGSEPSFEFPVKTLRCIRKVDVSEQRFVMGIVLEPEIEDSQGDIYSAVEIERAAHKFMEDARNLGIMHRRLANDGLVILQSFIAPCDFEINGQKVKKGSWVLAMRVKNDTIWMQVKNGEFTGLSIGGSAIRTPEPRRQS
jgi:DNA adenine methylase